MNRDLAQRLQNSPVVAAVKEADHLQMAMDSPCEVIFLLTGNIFDIQTLVGRCKEADKLVYVHVDLLEGFSRDAMALEYIREQAGPDGIITTKAGLIKAAHELEIDAIQRFFIVDSLSMRSAVKASSSIRPGAVEILPGIMPRVIGQLRQQLSQPIIAGGLISRKEDVIAALSAGAMGVSTTDPAIWKM